MRITIDNIPKILNASPAQLDILLPLLFAKLEEPDQDEIFLQNYTGAIKTRFAQDLRPPGQVKFDTFGEVALQAGIVKTMLKVTQNTRPGSACSIAAYQALDIFQHMVRTGNVAERKTLLQQLVENNAVEICLDKAVNHPLCMHRHLGVNMIRSFASESFLGEFLSAAQSSEIMVKMCQFVLTGPRLFIEQMGSPATTWQSCMTLGSLGVPISVAKTYAPRYYAMAQESAIWAVHGLLCRSPPSSQQFCLDILKHDPELIDLLFECAVVPRPAWYPETQVDSIACEALVLLFRGSLDYVPGVSTSVGDALQDEDDAERRALVESLQVLTSRKNWLEKIIAVWKKIDDEKWQAVKPLFDKVERNYFAQEVPDEESFLAIFEYRGTTRICMLRLITTITHATEECNVSDADLVSLLRIGYLGSQNIKSMAQISSESDKYTWVERAEEIFRTPMFTVATQEKVDAPEQIAEEAVLGPTALIRLLTVFAQRGVLDQIPSWKRLPASASPSTSLRQVQQITGQDVLRKILLLGVKRVTARREKGHKRFRERDLEYAGFGYSAAAELAAALVAFNSTTNGKWSNELRGAHKELVLCLGNAAEMAHLIQKYRRALVLALGAVSAGGNVPPQDALDEGVLAKNIRRVNNARAALGRS